MVATPTMSARGLALARTFVSAFSALRDHARHSPAEQQQLYQTIASHLRNAAPLALSSLPDPALMPVDVLLPLHIDLGDGAFVEVSVRDDGKKLLYVHSLGHDADVALTPGQADVIQQALGSRQ